MTYFYSRIWRRFIHINRQVGALISGLAAGSMAFFVGVVATVSLSERLTHHQADAPVIVFGLIVGFLLALAAIVGAARWLWPKSPNASRD
jgi:hypothetical protein